MLRAPRSREASVCVCMYDYHIAVAFDHWLRLKGDGGHSVNYIRQRTVSTSHSYTRDGGKRGEKRNGLQQRVSL